MEETALISITDPNSEFAAKYPNGLSLTDLIPFYEEVVQNVPIQLEWKFPGRIKRPTTQEIEAKKEEALKQQERQAIANQQNQQQSTTFAEFDFDLESDKVMSASTALASQRRPLGGSMRPVRERRVARLDKILQEDMVRRQLEAQLRIQQQPQPSQQPVVMAVDETPSTAADTLSDPPQPRMSFAQPEPPIAEQNTWIPNQLADQEVTSLVAKIDTSDQ